MTTLTPPDHSRCQAERPNGYNAFTLGGRPAMVRCSNKPTVIATEAQPGPDGLIGSMSLCEECKAELLKDYGPVYCGFTEVQRSYLVTWEINVEADNPTMASQDVADAYFQPPIAAGGPDSACVFKVTDTKTGETTIIDLEVARGQAF
ncbi:hypothetical protein D3C85_694470 [compost metagenome]